MQAWQLRLSTSLACLAVALAVAILPALEASAQTGPAAQTSSPPASGPEIRIGNNVFLVPDANARTITGWLVVLAGCADEADGKCVGIAHYLEHLLFINRDEESRSKVALFADGTGNGWTTHRATTYFQRFPARPEANAANLDKLVGFFVGLLSDVRVEPAQAERERNIVLQEYQQNTGRNPFARFSIALNLALMPDEPLGQRVIGSPETIKAFTTEAAKAFHTRWYSRDNAYIVLHGPLDRETVAAAVSRHIAPLPSKPVPAHVWKQPRSYAPVREIIRKTDKDARQQGVYLDRIVTIDESPALKEELDAAAPVLSSFLSSRLAGSPLEILMEQDGLVSEGRIGIGRVRDGTWRVSFSGVPAKGVDPDKVIEAARSYIAGLARKGLSDETVARLKMRIENERALLSQQPGLYAQALMGWLSSHYGYDRWHARSARHAAVTTASVNRLLEIVGREGREVAGILLPGAVVATGASNPPVAPSAAATLPTDTTQPGQQ